MSRDDLWCNTCKDQWPLGHTHAPELNFIETYAQRLFKDVSQGEKQMEKSEVIRNMENYIQYARHFMKLGESEKSLNTASGHLLNLLEIIDYVLYETGRLQSDLQDAEETLNRIEQSNILQAVKSYFSRKDWRRLAGGEKS